MQDTIVYSHGTLNATIDETPLQALLSGGILISISKKDMVTLDASQSYNPDYPDVDNLQ